MNAKIVNIRSELGLREREIAFIFSLAAVIVELVLCSSMCVMFILPPLRSQSLLGFEAEIASSRWTRYRFERRERMSTNAVRV